AHPDAPNQRDPRGANSSPAAAGAPRVPLADVGRHGDPRRRGVGLGLRAHRRHPHRHPRLRRRRHLHGRLGGVHRGGPAPPHHGVRGGADAVRPRPGHGRRARHRPARLGLPGALHPRHRQRGDPSPPGRERPRRPPGLRLLPRRRDRLRRRGAHGRGGAPVRRLRGRGPRRRLHRRAAPRDARRPGRAGRRAAQGALP
ncbi:MAG: hypothetical protein AVDCRST_MAG40-202, partial [uncultured Gemmatimonadaceae bacterium]